jgi:hypothetical protein
MAVYLHIGEPKTGTTYLRQTLWANRERLREHGVLIPGKRPVEHWLAAEDLRGIEPAHNDPFGPRHGAWERLARQARQAGDRAIIADELLGAASPEQVAHAIRSLAPAEVHVVLTVRDVASLLPAEWQETVKHRNTRSWADWLADVVDRESKAPDRRRYGFWNAHDTVAIASSWAAQLSPGRVHVVTVPRPGASDNMLWRRFAQVVGVAPEAADPDLARRNTSLGLADIELLRRVNAELPTDLPDWFYDRNVKSTLAHGALAHRPASSSRLDLPPDRYEWACTYAKDVVAALRDAGYEIVGDLDELLPEPPTDNAALPTDVAAADVLDAAVTAITALLTVIGKTQGVAAAAAAPATARQRGRLKSAAVGLSERHPALHRLRRGYWHLANAVRYMRAETRQEPWVGEDLEDS